MIVWQRRRDGLLGLKRRFEQSVKPKLTRAREDGVGHQAAVAAARAWRERIDTLAEFREYTKELGWLRRPYWGDGWPDTFLKLFANCRPRGFKFENLRCTWGRPSLSCDATLVDRLSYTFSGWVCGPDPFTPAVWAVDWTVEAND